MEWYSFCKLNYDLGIATTDALKIYVIKGKITVEQFQQITGKTYSS